MCVFKISIWVFDAYMYFELKTELIFLFLLERRCVSVCSTVQYSRYGNAIIYELYNDDHEAHFGEVNWLFNVKTNAISVIYVTAYTCICAGGLKKKLDLRSGSQHHERLHLELE